jgi:glycosyltransferase involved in cell wall biosynthesis
MEPLVSILIPAFNAESWLAETVKSALEQTWPRKEIIIVDDESTDETPSIARQFASKNVCVLSQSNQGAAAARNKAFSMSQGDYLQWLDADDVLAPDKIARQMEAARSGLDKRTLLSSAWGHFLYRVRKARFCPSSLWTDLPPIDWLLRKMGDGVFMQTATWLVSRELTEAAGPWDTRLSMDDDGEYFCRVLLASRQVRFVPGAKVFYRVSGWGSLSNVGRSNKKLESQFLSIQMHLRHIRALEDSQRVRKACLAYLQRWLICFYPERPDIVSRLRELASTLGGGLQTPRLSWKYDWIQRTLGWKAAKRAERAYNELKFSVVGSWDKVMCSLEAGPGRHYA